jgi:hypothetical protein
MNDSPNSTTSEPAAEADGVTLPKPPRHIPPVLPMDVRRQLADLARVPEQNREEFYDVIQMPVRLVWLADRRSLGTKAGAALVRAADAARTLHEAFDNLNLDDREWVENLWAKMPYKYWLSGLPRTVYGLSDLFSIAAGRARFQSPGDPNQRGTKKGTVKDLGFLEFVHYLLVVTEAWCGGKLTLHKHYQNGTLIDAINVLSPHLPNGVVPTPLPLGTIQKVKSNPGLFTGYPTTDFYTE